MPLLNFLYIHNLDAPAWAACLVTIFFTTAVTLLGLFLFRKIYPASLSKANNDTINLAMSVVSLFSSLLISLLVINVWNSYLSVERTVNLEAHTVEDIYRLSQAMPEPIKSELISDVNQYIEVVINEEWPAMAADKQVGDKGRKILLHSNNLLLQLHSNNPVTLKFHSKLLDKLSILFDARRDRILATKSHVPAVIWLVIWTCSFLIIITSYLYTAESFSLHLISTGFIAALLASTIFLIIIFGHPFQGSMRIQPNVFIDFSNGNLK